MMRSFGTVLTCWMLLGACDDECNYTVDECGGSARIDVRDSSGDAVSTFSIALTISGTPFELNCDGSSATSVSATLDSGENVIVTCTSLGLNLTGLNGRDYAIAATLTSASGEFSEESTSSNRTQSAGVHKIAA